MTATADQTVSSGAAPAPRPGSILMMAERLAAIQPSRLSAARAFMNKMVRERWDISIERFDIDENSSGTFVYSIKAPDREFSFIGFSNPPSSTARTGRIIGRSWDMMGTLNEGKATEADIESARVELPKLYSGRATANALVWCRSNRSMRIFDQTLNALAEGRQPQISDLSQVCYLLRNTGLDGNGTFGTRSFPSLGADHPLGSVLHAQMLTAYLMREYSCDLVEHLARLKSDKAVKLDPAIRSYLGVGNGSALGLIFFIQKHPRLISALLTARENAIAAARALPVEKGDARISHLLQLVKQAITFRQEDKMVYETFTSSQRVAEDLGRVVQALEALRDTGLVGGSKVRFPLDELAQHFIKTLSPEAGETFLSLLMELVPNVADQAIPAIDAPDEFTVNAAETTSELLGFVRRDYSWALTTDMSHPDAYRYVWYKSETAEEPRRGARDEVPDVLDLGLDICGDVQALAADLEKSDPDLALARFLLKHPQHRHLIARIQNLRGLTYHTPQANINAEDFVPIDLVRLMNVGIHGIDKTRDFLNRNLRGVLYHGAPTPQQIREGYTGTWFYPAEPVPAEPVPAEPVIA